MSGTGDRTEPTAGPPLRPALPGLGDVLELIARRAGEHDADGSFPFEAYEALQPTGALRLTIPTHAGGLGGGLADVTALVVALGAADPAVALPVSQHLMVHADTEISWSDEVATRVRRTSIDGVALINILRVEPEQGTPGRGGVPATVAERLPADAGWRISGRKTYSTAVPLLRWMMVWAATDDPEPLHGNFLVEAGTPGCSVDPTWDALGMRATRSDDLVLDDVEVPFEHAFGLAPQMRTTSTSQVWNPMMVAAVYHGVARSARDWLVRYLHERVPSNLGAPLASLPRFQTEVGRIEALLTTSDALLAGIGEAFDDGHAGIGPRASLAKHTITNNALDAVLAAVALVGNPGLSRRNPLERHLRNVLHGRIHSPQDDVILLNAGRAALGPLS